MTEPVTLEFIARQIERVLSEQAAMRSDLAWIRGHLSATTEILLRLEAGRPPPEEKTR